MSIETIQTELNQRHQERVSNTKDDEYEHLHHQLPEAKYRRDWLDPC